MKIALVADIHSNLAALEAVVADAALQGADKFVFCGDYICDGPDTAAVTRRVKALSDFIVAGNREQYMLDHRSGKSDWKMPQYASLQWIYDRLSEAELDWMAGLPKMLRFTLDGKRFNVSHGSPYRQRDNLKPQGTEAVFERMIADFDDDIYVFAHTHRQFSVRHRGRLFINPGSAGMPTDSPGFKYSLIDTSGSASVTPRALPYDFITICEYYNKYGFVADNGFWGELFLATLRDNIDWMPRFVSFMHLFAAERGVADTSAIPDDVFYECVKTYRQRFLRGREQK